MVCPKCESRMGCNQTRNYTDPDRGFVYVERRRICGNCGHRMMTVELDQETYVRMTNERRKQEISERNAQHSQ